MRMCMCVCVFQTAPDRSWYQKPEVDVSCPASRADWQRPVLLVVAQGQGCSVSILQHLRKGKEQAGFRHSAPA